MLEWLVLITILLVAGKVAQKRSHSARLPVAARDPLPGNASRAAMQTGCDWPRCACRGH